MKVCILGTGVMGAGIASLFCVLEDTNELIIWGRSESSLKAAQESILKQIEKILKKEGNSTDAIEACHEKLSLTTELSSLSDCDLYIEAVQECLNTKRELFRELANFIDDKAIVATNTSSISVTELSMCTRYPQNFVGLHFFNPTIAMKLVEIIKGLATSEDTLDRVHQIIVSMNKNPVMVNDSPGFIVNRMLIPMINEAVSILAEGVAERDDIDNAMRFGANHPLGPLALSDLIGNDVCLSIMHSLYDETGDPKYRAHPLLKQYVRAGLLGRKNKVGFYDYR